MMNCMQALMRFDDAAVQKTIFSAGFDAAKTGIDMIHFEGLMY